MGNCSRCQRTTILLVECEECHEQFCETHRTPRDHDCRALSADDGGDPDATADGPRKGELSGGPSENDTTEPTVLYPEEVEGGAPDGSPSGGGDDGGPSVPMDFDPTLGIDRLLWTGGVVAAVLVVGLLAGGFLWMGPGVGVSSDVGSGGSDADSPVDGSAASENLDAARIERLIHEYINRERQEAGVPPMEYDDDLATIGEYHSRDMYERGYVRHTGPDGETITDRYQEFGYDCETNGEIIQWVDYGEVNGSGEAALARAVVENWMDSELHRSFVLNESWERHGLGVYLADSGRAYVTQNTCGGG